MAIKKGPKTNKKWPNGTHHAYYKGEVFDLIEHVDSESMLIKYSDTEIDRLHVMSENFMSLEEWRGKRIDKLLKKNNIMRWNPYIC